MEDCPANWEGETVDAGGDHVLPGFIDAHSHLGMFGDAMGFEGDDGNEATDPCTPHLRAIDAIYPQDRCFQEAREGGVTTVLTGPARPTHRRAVPGPQDRRPLGGRDGAQGPRRHEVRPGGKS